MFLHALPYIAFLPQSGHKQKLSARLSSLYPRLRSARAIFCNVLYTGSARMYDIFFILFSVVKARGVRLEGVHILACEVRETRPRRAPVLVFELRRERNAFVKCSFYAYGRTARA